MNLYTFVLISVQFVIVWPDKFNSQSFVDLSAPIDLTKGLLHDGKTKAKIVFFNNRKEARLPFHNPRQNPNEGSQKNDRNRLEGRREDQFHSIQTEDKPDDLNIFNVDFKNKVENRFKQNEQDYRPFVTENNQRLEMERRRGIERQINKAIRNRDQLIVKDSQVNKYKPHSLTYRGDIFNRIPTSGQTLNHNANWKGNLDFENKVSTAFTTSHKHSSVTDAPRPLGNRQKIDRRKPPILIFEEVPVYVTKDDIYPSDYPQQSDDIYEPNRTVDTQLNIDRRPPGRFFGTAGGNDYSEDINHSAFSDHENLEKYKSVIYDKPAEFDENSDSLFVNGYEEIQKPFLESSNSMNDDVFIPQPNQFSHVGSVSNTLIPAQQPLGIRQGVISQNVDGYSSHSGARVTAAQAQVAFHRRLQAVAAAEAIALSALRQQAVAALAFNQQLNHAAALSKLQQSATAAHARGGSQAGDHTTVLHQSTPGVVHSTDFQYTATSSDDVVHDPDIIDNNAFFTSQGKDTLTNQIKKHTERIGADDHSGLHVDRDELTKLLVRIRPHFTKRENGFELETWTPFRPPADDVAPLTVLKPLPLTSEIPPPPLEGVANTSKLPPGIEIEFVKYLLEMPEDAFKKYVKMPKNDFLVMLFPRLYRHQVHHTQNDQDHSFSASSTPPSFGNALTTAATFTFSSSAPHTTSSGHHFSSSPPPFVRGEEGDEDGNFQRHLQHVLLTHENQRGAGPVKTLTPSRGSLDDTRGTSTSTLHRDDTAFIRPEPVGFKFPDSIDRIVGPFVSHRGSPSHNGFIPRNAAPLAQESSYSTPLPVGPFSFYNGGFRPIVFTTSVSPEDVSHVGSPDDVGSLHAGLAEYSAFVTTEKPFGTVTSVLKRPETERVYSTTPVPAIVDSTVQEADFKDRQPFYTTVHPSLFLSTITHPRSTSPGPSFATGQNAAGVHTENSEENNLVEEEFRDIPPVLTLRPGPLIGGFEGVLRPPSALDHLREQERRRTEAVLGLPSAVGTDSNHDSHVLSPFESRQGGETVLADEVNNMSTTLPILIPKFQYQEIPSVVKFATPIPASLLSQTSSISPRLNFVITTHRSSSTSETSETNHETSPEPAFGASTSPSVIPSSAASEPPLEGVTKRGFVTPMPQRVDLSVLPSVAFSGPGDDSGSGAQALPSIEAIISSLPAYLRQAPPCAGSPPSQRAFCLVDQDYPRDAAEKLAATRTSELEQLQELLKKVEEPQVNLEEAAKQIQGLDSRVECEVQHRSVELGWARDVLGNWLAVLQTSQYPQVLNVTACNVSARAKGCRPLLLPRPMAAFHPMDTEHRPLVGSFPVPVMCVFASKD